MQPKRDSLISAEQNRRMFDAITARYDLLNCLLSLGLDRCWRRRTVHVLGPVSGGRYLDLGTGTADLAIAICRHAPGATVVGVDLSQQMIAAARTKLRRLGLAADCALVPADALRLPFAAATFAGATSAFLLRNAEDRLRLLTEVHRVLAPGGRVAMLDLTRPRNPLLRLGHSAYLRLVVPTLGHLLARGDAYQYLARSIRFFPDPQAIAAELAAAGFEQVSALPLSAGIVTLFCGRRPEPHPQP